VCGLTEQAYKFIESPVFIAQVSQLKTMTEVNNLTHDDAELNELCMLVFP